MNPKARINKTKSWCFEMIGGEKTHKFDKKNILGMKGKLELQILQILKSKILCQKFLKLR